MFDPKVDELVPRIPIGGLVERENDNIIRTRKISDYAILYSAYGRNIDDFVFATILNRVSDLTRTASSIVIGLFRLLFSKKHRLFFNRVLEIEKETLIEKGESFAKEGIDVSREVGKIEQKKGKTVKMEIDTTIELVQLRLLRKERHFEIKMYTTPDDTNRILASYLIPSVLKHNLYYRDFMGFITFSTIHDSQNIGQRITISEDEKRNVPYDWIIHFCVVDKRIMKDKSSGIEKADYITEKIKEDQEFFSNELSLNRYNGSMSLIKNYLKVVEMSYQIETLKNKLEKAEIELQNRSEAIKRGEEAIKRGEEAIKRRDERIVKLEKFLKDQGIDVPEGLLPKENEE